MNLPKIENILSFLKQNDISLAVNNIISFRPVYYRNGKEVDLKNLSLTGYLLGGFKWSDKEL